MPARCSNERLIILIEGEDLRVKCNKVCKNGSNSAEKWLSRIAYDENETGEIQLFLVSIIIVPWDAKYKWNKERRRSMIKCQRNFQSPDDFRVILLHEIILIIHGKEVRFILLKEVPFFLFYSQRIVSNEGWIIPSPFCACKITFQLDFIEDEIPAGNQRIKATLLTLYPKIFLIRPAVENRGMKC